jgi:hypothetical protein
MGASEDGAELREMFELSGQRMLTILEDVLLLTEIEVASDTFSFEATGLVSTLHSAIECTAAFGIRLIFSALIRYRVGVGVYLRFWSTALQRLHDSVEWVKPAKFIQSRYEFRQFRCESHLA